jgi:RHS repeat-associated protein
LTGGSAINFAYDDDELLTSAGAYAITRDAVNGFARSALLGVVGDDWTHNEFGQTASHSVTINAVPVYDVNYMRDDLGRIAQKTETIEGINNTFDYDYDLRGQLTEVRKNGVVAEAYSYDANGNRTSATVGGADSSASHDAQDRLLAYGENSYSYTPAGRLTTRTGPGNLVTEYDYDVLGNLLAVRLPDGTEITYDLDGQNRRIQRSVDGTITHRFLYDGNAPVAELDQLGNVVSQFVYAEGGVPAYMIKSGVNYRIVTDQTGSVRLVINADTGTVVQRMDYDSFGHVVLDTNPGFQPFGFAGGLNDPVTGLVRLGARDFDATVGRWTSKDPSWFRDGLNLYRYAGNDPVNFYDRSGAAKTEAELVAEIAAEVAEELASNEVFGEPTQPEQVVKPETGAKKSVKERLKERNKRGREARIIKQDKLNRKQMSECSSRLAKKGERLLGVSSKAGRLLSVVNFVTHYKMIKLVVEEAFFGKDYDLVDYGEAYLGYPLPNEIKAGIRGCDDPRVICLGPAVY